MTDTLRARDGQDVEDAVQWALGQGKAIEVVGQGTKRTIGRPAQTDLTLDLSALSGVTLYEPEELVLTARAGTTIATIEALIGAKKQQLAFEPMDYGPLLGGGAVSGGSIGGALAVNLSGPRRLRAGAARDHFLGFIAVSGRGETFKSGGRVVKNVTGYDLCKLMAGSWGTLAIMTEVTVKVLPLPETETTLAVLGLDDASAIRAMAAAMGTSCEVSAAAHLPVTVVRRIPIAEATGDGRALTLLRLEGVAPSVDHRKTALHVAIQDFGEVAICDQMVSRGLWRAIRDVTVFAWNRTGAEQPLWRISTAPAKGAELARLIGPETELMFDWAGGLLWALLPQTDDAGAAMVRRAVATCGGHATLIRAPAAARAAAAVFEPQDAGLAALTRRVKEGFDPKGVLNPGRMWAGL
jgi:glycolate oxidase FAD binding subunit